METVVALSRYERHKQPKKYIEIATGKIVSIISVDTVGDQELATVRDYYLDNPVTRKVFLDELELSED